jgi:hypothetical protein
MTAAPETAALINGTFGHALDYDDVLSIMPAHPSVVIVAALLASLNGKRVDGRAFIEAYIVGVEIGGNIGIGMTNGHYQRGFHATGTLALALVRFRKVHRFTWPTRGRLSASLLDGGPAAQLRHDDKPLHYRHRARSAHRLQSCRRRV